MNSFVPILVNTLPEEARWDEADILTQIEAVKEGLRDSGYRSWVMEYTTNVEKLLESFQRIRPLAVFNLVEAVHNQNRLQYMAPLYLQRLGVPFTGNSSEALRLTTDKILAKGIMAKKGVRTPWWIETGTRLRPAEADLRRRTRTLIFKPVDEDASVGLREDLIGPHSWEKALDVLQRLQGDSGLRYMAEEYIEGREINVSLIEVGGAPCLLPEVEQDFSHLPSGFPHVVGYRAKWDKASLEYGRIPRAHRFSSGDERILEVIRNMALQCWYIFDLSGYARVDFRVDRKGTPFVLEVNANPCLSPEAGFAYAASLMGLTMKDLVCLIVDSALRRSRSRPKVAVR